jgi:biopolymer transport protein ExbB/TolQ
MTEIPKDLWYTAFMLLIAIIGFMIRRYMERLEKTMDRFENSINELTTLFKLHDEQIKQLQARNGPKRRQ